MSSATQPSTPKEIMDWLHTKLQTDPSRTQGVNAIFAFDISGDHGGSWWLEAKDGVGAVHPGAHEQPTVTIHLSDEDFVRLGTGQLDGGEAYFNGLLTVDGEAGRAIFLNQIFGT